MGEEYEEGMDSLAFEYGIAVTIVLVLVLVRLPSIQRTSIKQAGGKIRIQSDGCLLLVLDSMESDGLAGRELMALDRPSRRTRLRRAAARARGDSDLLVCEHD